MSQASRKAPVRYLRAPVPLHFPESATVPETKTHLYLRSFLFHLLQYALGKAHAVGSDQFVYWVSNDTGRCVAPDVFVKLGTPDSQFGSWKTWERGTLDLAVEFASKRDGIAWEEKLARYHELGVGELVRFDAERPEGERLCVWDRVDGDFVERQVEGDSTPCLTLDCTWVVMPVGPEPVGLRLLDADGALVLNGEETERARADALEEELRRLRAERGA